MNKNKGFILIETMLAIVILGVILVVSIQAISGFVRTSSSSYNVSIAGMYAQKLLADMKKNEFAAGKNEGEFDDKYSWKVSKQRVDETHCQYDFTVIWNEQGQDKDITFTTYRFEKSEEDDSI